MRRVDMKKLALVIVLALIALTQPLTARAVDVVSEQADALELGRLENALPSDAGDMLGGVSVMDGLSPQTGLKKLWTGITDRLRAIVSGAVKNAAVVLLAALLCGTVSAAFPEKYGNYATLAGILAIAAVSAGNVTTFIGVGEGVMDELSAFSKMLLPTLSAAAAASGAITSAAVKYAATVLFLDVLMSVARGVVLPLIYAFVAASIADAAMGNDALAGVASLIKWLARTVLTIIGILFTLYLSIVSVISGAGDAAALRAAKVTISTVLPVVGGIIADAADTVLSGAAIVRNAVGIFGLLAVAATCAVPFIRLGANYLLFKAAGGLSDAVADKRISKLVNAIGTALGLTLATAGLAAVMLFVSIVSVIKVAA
jgi:stage III sporulation protein AE